MTDSLISNPERWANEVLSLLKKDLRIKAVESEERILVSFILLDRERTKTERELLEEYLFPTVKIFTCAVNGVVSRENLPLEFSFMWRRTSLSSATLMSPFWPPEASEVTETFNNISIQVVMWYDLARQGVIIVTELCLGSE